MLRQCPASSILWHVLGAQGEATERFTRSREVVPREAIGAKDYPQTPRDACD